MKENFGEELTEMSQNGNIGRRNFLGLAAAAGIAAASAPILMAKESKTCLECHNSAQIHFHPAQSQVNC